MIPALAEDTWVDGRERSSSSPSRAPARRCSRPRSPSAPARKPAGCGPRRSPRSLTKLQATAHVQARTRRRQLRRPHRTCRARRTRVSRAPRPRQRALLPSRLRAQRTPKRDLHDKPPDLATRPRRSPTKASQTVVDPDRHQSAIDRHRQRVLARPPRPRRRNQQEEHHGLGFTRRTRVLPTSTAITQRHH